MRKIKEKGRGLAAFWRRDIQRTGGIQSDVANRHLSKTFPCAAHVIEPVYRLSLWETITGLEIHFRFSSVYSSSTEIMPGVVERDSRSPVTVTFLVRRSVKMAQAL